MIYKPVEQKPIEKMTDGELAATIRALSDEQQRRAAKPTDKRLELAQEAVRRHRERCFG